MMRQEFVLVLALHAVGKGEATIFHDLAAYWGPFIPDLRSSYFHRVFSKMLSCSVH